MSAYYNDNDPKVAAWLRELIARGLVEDGSVDERSIREVRPGGCAERSHFFAGIGGWPYALALAGWPADAPVWTGSCPCQPFSAAGRGGGHEDARHLWPEFFRLIAECRPATVFGEQVASRDGRCWLAGVRADLETLGYAVGAADLCAAGVGSPHPRQRLFWVAHAQNADRGPGAGWPDREEAGDGGVPGGLGDTTTQRRAQAGELRPPTAAERAGGHGAPGRMGDTDQQGLEGRGLRTGDVGGEGGELDPLAAGREHWSDYDIAWCLDPRRPEAGYTVPRRIASGSFPLAQRVPARVVRLRGYGNAIIPQVAATFVRAFMEATLLRGARP